jgi:acyl CoA:acetate/3-ketoacid CoA transferase beta subunit
VFDIEGGLVLREIAPGTTVEDVRMATAAPFSVADDLVEMSLLGPHDGEF